MPKTKQLRIQRMRHRIRVSWLEGVLVGVLLFIFNYLIQLLLFKEKPFVWSDAIFAFITAIICGLLLGGFIKWFFTRRLKKILREP